MAEKDFRFEYKGWAVVIRREGYHNQYAAAAHRKGARSLHAWGGARATAETAIKSKVDQTEGVANE